MDKIERVTLTVEEEDVATRVGANLARANREWDLTIELLQASRGLKGGALVEFVKEGNHKVAVFAYKTSSGTSNDPSSQEEKGVTNATG